MEDLIRTLILVGAYFAGAAGLFLVITRFVPGGLALSQKLFGGYELWFAFAIAAAMTAASLTLSEVFHYDPCRWCWIQRIFAYPNVAILGWAAFRRDRNAWAPALTLAGLGLAASTWHIALDNRWIADNGSCDPAVPCTVRWNGFDTGYSTIQVGAFCCFLFIIGAGLHALARRTEPSDAADYPEFIDSDTAGEFAGGLPSALEA